MTRPLTAHQISELMAALVVAQTGWNDISVDGTAEQIRTRWTNPAAATEAVRTVCDTWTSSGRPPWGVLNDAYRAAVRRHSLDVRQLDASTRTVSFARGRQIAAAAYRSEMERQGRTPNPVVLDSFLASVDPDA